jgi:hypothetical protein
MISTRGVAAWLSPVIAGKIAKAKRFKTFRRVVGMVNICGKMG